MALSDSRMAGLASPSRQQQQHSQSSSSSASVYASITGEQDGSMMQCAKCKIKLRREARYCDMCGKMARPVVVRRDNNASSSNVHTSGSGSASASTHQLSRNRLPEPIEDELTERRYGHSEDLPKRLWDRPRELLEALKRSRNGRVLREFFVQYARLEEFYGQECTRLASALPGHDADHHHHVHSSNNTMQLDAHSSSLSEAMGALGNHLAVQGRLHEETSVILKAAAAGKVESAPKSGIPDSVTKACAVMQQLHHMDIVVTHEVTRLQHQLEKSGQLLDAATKEVRKLEEKVAQLRPTKSSTDSGAQGAKRKHSFLDRVFHSPRTSKWQSMVSAATTAGAGTLTPASLDEVDGDTSPELATALQNYHKATLEWHKQSSTHTAFICSAIRRAEELELERGEAHRKALWAVCKLLRARSNALLPASAQAARKINHMRPDVDVEELVAFLETGNPCPFVQPTDGALMPDSTADALVPANPAQSTSTSSTFTKPILSRTISSASSLFPAPLERPPAPMITPSSSSASSSHGSSGQGQGGLSSHLRAFMEKRSRMQRNATTTKEAAISIANAIKAHAEAEKKQKDQGGKQEKSLWKSLFAKDGKKKKLVAGHGLALSPSTGQLARAGAGAIDHIELFSFLPAHSSCHWQLTSETWPLTMYESLLLASGLATSGAIDPIVKDAVRIQVGLTRSQYLRLVRLCHGPLLEMRRDLHGDDDDGGSSSVSPVPLTDEQVLSPRCFVHSANYRLAMMLALSPDEFRTSGKSSSSHSELLQWFERQLAVIYSAAWWHLIQFSGQHPPVQWKIGSGAAAVSTSAPPSRQILRDDEMLQRLIQTFDSLHQELVHQTHSDGSCHLTSTQLQGVRDMVRDIMQSIHDYRTARDGGVPAVPPVIGASVNGVPTYLPPLADPPPQWMFMPPQLVANLYAHAMQTCYRPPEEDEDEDEDEDEADEKENSDGSSHQRKMTHPSSSPSSSPVLAPLSSSPLSPSPVSGSPADPHVHLADYLWLGGHDEHDLDPDTTHALDAHSPPDGKQRHTRAHKQIQQPGAGAGVASGGGKALSQRAYSISSSDDSDEDDEFDEDELEERLASLHPQWMDIVAVIRRWGRALDVDNDDESPSNHINSCLAQLCLARVIFHVLDQQSSVMQSPVIDLSAMRTSSRRWMADEDDVPVDADGIVRHGRIRHRRLSSAEDWDDGCLLNVLEAIMSDAACSIADRRSAQTGPTTSSSASSDSSIAVMQLVTLMSRYTEQWLMDYHGADGAVVARVALLFYQSMKLEHDMEWIKNNRGKTAATSQRTTSTSNPPPFQPNFFQQKLLRRLLLSSATQQYSRLRSCFPVDMITWTTEDWNHFFLEFRLVLQRDIQMYAPALLPLIHAPCSVTIPCLLSCLGREVSEFIRSHHAGVDDVFLLIFRNIRRMPGLILMALADAGANFNTMRLPSLRNRAVNGGFGCTNLARELHVLMGEELATRLIGPATSPSITSSSKSRASTSSKTSSVASPSQLPPPSFFVDVSLLATRHLFTFLRVQQLPKVQNWISNSIGVDLEWRRMDSMLPYSSSIIDCTSILFDWADLFFNYCELLRGVGFAQSFPIFVRTLDELITSYAVIVMATCGDEDQVKPQSLVDAKTLSKKNKDEAKGARARLIARARKNLQAASDATIDAASSSGSSMITAASVNVPSHTDLASQSLSSLCVRLCNMRLGMEKLDRLAAHIHDHCRRLNRAVSTKAATLSWKLKQLEDEGVRAVMAATNAHAAQPTPSPPSSPPLRPAQPVSANDQGQAKPSSKGSVASFFANRFQKDKKKQKATNNEEAVAQPAAAPARSSINPSPLPNTANTASTSPSPVPPAPSAHLVSFTSFCQSPLIAHRVHVQSVRSVLRELEECMRKYNIDLTKNDDDNDDDEGEDDSSDESSHSQSDAARDRHASQLFPLASPSYARYADDISSVIATRLVYVEWKSALLEQLYTPSPSSPNADLNGSGLYDTIDAGMAELYQALGRAHFHHIVPHVFTTLMQAMEWVLLIKPQHSAKPKSKENKKAQPRLVSSSSPHGMCAETLHHVSRFTSSDRFTLESDLQMLMLLFSVELSMNEMEKAAESYQQIITTIPAE